MYVFRIVLSAIRVRVPTLSVQVRISEASIFRDLLLVQLAAEDTGALLISIRMHVNMYNELKS